MKGHTWDHGKGDPCKLCGEVHIGGHSMSGHNWGICQKCGCGKDHGPIPAKGRIAWNKGKKMLNICGNNNPSKRPEVREKIGKSRRTYTDQNAKDIIDDYLSEVITVAQLSKRFNISIFVVQDILGKYLSKQTKAERVKLIRLYSGKKAGLKNKGRHLPQETIEKMKKNPVFKETGKKVQAQFWQNKTEFRKVIGRRGYLGLKKKKGEEWFHNVLPILNKNPNSFELEVKEMLENKGIKFEYQKRTKHGIPDFVLSTGTIIEATSLYPFQKGIRVKKKIDQIQKYKNEGDVILVTPNAEQWEKVLENEKIIICTLPNLEELLIAN